MNWSFLTPVASVSAAMQTNDTVHIVPNDRGGWAILLEGEPSDSKVGNYPTPTDAARIARITFSKVIMPDEIPVGIAAIPTKSPQARLAELSSI